MGALWDRFVRALPYQSTTVGQKLSQWHRKWQWAEGDGYRQWKKALEAPPKDHTWDAVQEIAGTGDYRALSEEQLGRAALNLCRMANVAGIPLGRAAWRAWLKEQGMRDRAHVVEVIK